MVRNEADVIEAFVRHHAEIVDELVVVDHRSVDGTDETLRALVAEGLPLRVRAENSPIQRQNVIMTGLMREAAVDGDADWILPLDADEFVVAPQGSVRDELAALPGDRPSSVDMRLYVPTQDDPADEPNVLRRLTHRRELDGSTWRRKVVVPAHCARDSRFTMTQGNHGLQEQHTAQFATVVPTERLALAHFPVRSASQLARKVLGGWPAHVARPDRPQNDAAFQWRRAFEAVTAGGRLTEEQAREIALDYALHEPGGEAVLVHDPMPVSFELRYPVSAGPEPLEVLAETALRLAEELSDARRDDP
jgi:hypothetical protein